MKNVEHIVIFEHEKLIFDLKKEKERALHESLERFHGDYSPYFSLIRNGVQFNSYVGVIQVGNTTIEVLPKADKSYDEATWQKLLIGMIKTIWGFEVQTTGTSNLKLRGNSILDLYFELYIKELEFLLHCGLIKRYNTREGNLTSLKGALQFPKHIAQNLTHKERFYVKYSHYNPYHSLHCILYKALKLLCQLNHKPELKSRLGNLLLNFPEMNDIKVTPSSFEKIKYDRKNSHYRNAVEIAKLLLLNYHPDVQKGNNHVLALMFDMNLLWEQFVYVTLRRNLKDYLVKSQVKRNFWQHESGSNTRMIPDILVMDKKENVIAVLDTKWKNINDAHPSPEDLRQMFTYHTYFQSQATALIYPNSQTRISKGTYYNWETWQPGTNTCSVIQIGTLGTIKEWQQKILGDIAHFIQSYSFN